MKKNKKFFLNKSLVSVRGKGILRLQKHLCAPALFVFGQQKNNRYSFEYLLFFGAGNETRTRDIHLGKVTLYH